MSTGHISRDVVFNEENFPFTKLHPNTDAQLCVEIFLLPPTLCTSHGYVEIDASRAYGANPGVENVNVQAGELAEELALTQEDENSKNSPTARAMDPVSTMDPGSASTLGSVLQSRPGSSPDHVPTNRIGSALHSVPAASKSGMHSPVRDTPMLLEDSRVTGDTEADGSAVLSRSVAGEYAEEENSAVSRIQMPPAVDRPRTRLLDNIVKPKIFSDGTVRYDHGGLGVT
jgi:hypothetical protein